MNQNYLFIGAHPDDIEFGAGATIAKARSQGINCRSAIFSDCHESLDSQVGLDFILQESREAHSVLGVSDESISIFDFPVRNFSTHRQQILQSMIDDFSNVTWDKVFIPNRNDIHQDHSVISTEAMRAFKFSTILGYELPWNNFISNVNYYNLISQSNLQAKIAAISCFNSQANRFYSGAEKVTTTLRFRGLQVRQEYAEAFEIYRFIQQ